MIQAVARRLPSELRRGLKTQKEIAAEVATLRDRAAELERVLENMRDAQVPKMEVDGVTKIERGDKLTADYIANCEKALVDAKRNRER